MRSTIYFIISSLFFLTSIQAQESFEYMGFIFIQDSLKINYELNFELEEGVIRGYSVSDGNGPHETKTAVLGHYDADKDILSFRETDIIYTKSNITRNDFCNIYFQGYMRRISERVSIEGDFNGYYPDYSSCLNGSIVLGGISKMKRRATRVDNRIQRSDRFSDSIKENVSMIKRIDSLRMNIMRSNEILNIHWQDESVTLNIYDAGREDGDKIMVSMNNNVILRNHTVTNASYFKQVELATQNSNEFVIEALNNGTEGGNTAKVILIDSQGNETEFLTSLKVGEKTIIRLLSEPIN